MARNRKPRKAYRPQPVHTNAHHLAVARVHRLLQDDVARQIATMRNALHQFMAGQDCAAHWRSLADTTNVAEELARIGICSGPQAAEIISCAKHVLHDVHTRHRLRGTWTLYALEVDTLQWLLTLHARQLHECDYAEFERAMTSAHNRIAQVRAGNAPAGAVVVQGDIA